MIKNILNKTIATGIALSMLIGFTAPVIAYTNEETFYSKVDSTGKKYETIVSTLEEEKSKQKEVEADTPIEYEVTYKLDGKVISAEDIAGKSGKITISLKFKNKEEQKVNVNGKEETMYTPFLVVSGVVIDNETNKNIEISQGKLVNNGKNTIAVGFAIPGLIESLNLQYYNTFISDTIEITLETDKFEMGNIMTYASPKLLSSLNINSEDFNKIFNKIDELQSASKQIEDGAKSLNDGIGQLDDGITSLKNGSNTLNDGVDSLQVGSKELNSGATTLKNGIAEYSENEQEFNKAVSQVSTGVSSLNSQYSELDYGINSLNNNSTKLENGASSVAQGAQAVSNNLNTISSNLTALSSGATSINSGLADAQDGINQIITGLQNQSSSIETELTSIATNEGAVIAKLQASNSTLEAQIESTEDDDLKADLQSIVDSNNEMIQLLSENSSSFTTVSNNTKIQTQTLTAGLSSLKSGVDELKKGANSLDEGLSQISVGTNQLANSTSDLVDGAKSLHDGTISLSQGTASLANGSSKVVAGLNTLDQGTNSLEGASNQLTTASKKIEQGASSLQSGTESLVTGVKGLKEGTNELVTGTNTLSEGSKQLVNGSKELVQGIEQFNSQGINTIVNFANNNGKNLIKRFEKLEELSKNYEYSYNGKDKYNNVQFISVMDSVKAKSNEEE